MQNFQAFNVKFNVFRPKKVTVLTNIIVLAKTREEGVFEATKTMRETIDELGDATMKLVSASTLSCDLFLIEPKLLESITNK